MRRSLTRSRLLTAALTVLAAALILGSAQSTGASWRDNSTVADSTVTAGSLSLAAGTGSDPSFRFPALTGSNIVPGQQIQAALAITNTGTTPLTYRLNTAGPAVSSGGGVVVNLSGSVSASCGPGPLAGPVAFTAFDTSSTSTTATSSPRPLAPGVSETWCIRAELQSVTGAQPAVYTLTFTFGANQA